MNKIKVAIIDDGINSKFSPSIKLYKDYEVLDNSIVLRNSKEFYDWSHGSVCATIFCNYAENYELYSIKVLNNRGRADKKDLIIALEWCLLQNIDIINLSLGSSHYKDYSELKIITDKLILNNTTIIAAGDNRNIRTYPASFNDVIGVKTDRTELLAEEQFVFIENPYDGIDVLSFGKFNITLSNGEKKQLSASNSYATPYITALICNYRSKGYKNYDIQRYLKDNSFSNDVLTYSFVKSNILDWKSKIDVPIIGVTYSDGSDKALIVDFLLEFTNKFRQDSYNCILCFDEEISSQINFVYDVGNYTNGIDLDYFSKFLVMFNVERPDIIIYCVRTTELNTLKEISILHGVDIILSFGNKQIKKELKSSNIKFDKKYMIVKERTNALKRRLFSKYNINEDRKRLYEKVIREYK